MDNLTYFTSEAVTEGHPDKVADRISDHLLDCFLSQDPNSHVAIETLVSKDLVVLAGEVTTKGIVDYRSEVSKVLEEIGYTDPSSGFSSDNFTLMVNISKQSPDIAMGVNRVGAIGAGDQGMMFGYATSMQGTPNYMPLPHYLANELVKALDLHRHICTSPIRPDGKSQVTVAYKDGVPCKVDTVVLSTSHAPMEQDEYLDFEAQMQTFVRNNLLNLTPLVTPDNVSAVKILINPTGRFEKYGPAADTGLTGRKIVCDQYGGFAPVGGGAFSGKDPTKVDRSAAYAARQAARYLVQKGMANEVTIQLAYAIGVPEPVSINVKSDLGPDQDIYCARVLKEKFDFTPAGIINRLNLQRPIYEAIVNYGHMGAPQFLAPWEVVDNI